MPIATRITLAVCLLTAAAAARAQNATPAAAAKVWLSAALEDPKKQDAVLTALRVSGDRDAAPIFAALTRSGDKRHRLAATAALARLAPEQAPPVLLERLRQDSLHTIRAEALAQLLELKAISVEQLQEAVQIDDDNIRCLAARGLVRLGQKTQAAAVLRKLVESKDLATACLARVTLVGLGEMDHLAPLGAAMHDASTADSIVALVLQQAGDEKALPVRELAGEIAGSARPVAVRVMAYKTLAALAPDGPALLAKAILEQKQIILRVHLMNLLSSADNNRQALTSLADDDGTIGVLAKLELGRAAQDAQAGQAAGQALHLGHPVVVDYVLDRVGKDVAAHGAKTDYYTAPLLGFIRSLDSDSREMSVAHIRAARAATLLCDLGTPAAMAGIKELATGRHGTLTQAVAGGMRWSKNRSVCDIARLMLDNPYHAVAVDAAMTLGMFGDPQARDPLARLLARHDREQTTLVTLAAWYLLKIESQSLLAAQDLAKQIK